MNGFNRIYFIIVLYNIFPSNGNLIKLYEGYHFEGLMWQGPGSTRCVNIPFGRGGEISSLKTAKCLMIFQEYNCGGYNLKLESGTAIANLSEVGHFLTKFDRKVKSFYECNDIVGGKDVHVELRGPLYPLADYFDVTDCINIPANVYSELKKVWNYGNCVELYSEIDCGEGGESNKDLQVLRLFGGNGPENEDIGLMNFTGLARSIKPCFRDIL